MNNSRFDSHDRKKLFNFQFQKYLQPVKTVYLAKYDYMSLPESFQEKFPEQDERDIVSNPDDDISEDAFEPRKTKVNQEDLRELAELDDLFDDTDIDKLAAPVKMNATTASSTAEEPPDIAITQAELDDLMEEYLELKANA